MTRYPDKPKSLGTPAVRAERRELLALPHVAPLTDFAHALRAERGLGDEIPYFDPLDGGVYARCLCLLEAPGARAVASGFISRDNPDESAKNSFLLYQEAGIPRSETVLWNIVPWYIGSGTRIRPANSADIREGLRYLGRLLNLLPRLEVIVTVGQKAQKAQRHIGLMRPEVAAFRSPHPSPLFVNNKPGNRGVILDVLKEVAAELRLVPDAPLSKSPVLVRRQGEDTRPPWRHR